MGLFRRPRVHLRARLQPRLRRWPGRVPSSGPPAPALGTPDEDVVVRQYRYLLRTAPIDALEAAHAEALEALDTEVRAAVLRAAQRQLVAGLRLTPEDTWRLAHLITLGERRVPGLVLAGYGPATLQRLARAVVDTEAVFGLFGGYAAWDGAEPEPVAPAGDMSGFDEAWHQVLEARLVYRGLAGGPSTPDSWGGAGF